MVAVTEDFRVSEATPSIGSIIDADKETLFGTLWSADQRIAGRTWRAVAATDQLSRSGSISDATWEALPQRLDRCGMMDLIYSIGFFAMKAWGVGDMQLEAETDTSYSKAARNLLASDRRGRGSTMSRQHMAKEMSGPRSNNDE